MTHVVFWKKYRPDLHGKSCKVLARGRGRGPRNVLLEIEETGERVVMPRYAARRLN